MVGSLSCLALLLLAAQDPAADAEGVRDLANQSRYAAALELVAHIEPPLDRDRLRSEVLWAARDFGSALGATRTARALAPDDLALAWREAGCLLWLRDGASALAVLAELEGALGRAELGADDQRAWREVVEDYRGQATELVRRREALEGAVGRARLFSLAGLGAALVGLFALGRRA